MDRSPPSDREPVGIPLITAPVLEVSSRKNPEFESLVQSENPTANQVVMDKPTDEQACVAQFEHCEEKAESDWLCYPK